MTATLQELKSAVNNLSESERAELAHYILHSLDGEDETDVRAEWVKVAKERSAELKAGKVVGIPLSEVLKRLPGAN